MLVKTFCFRFSLSTTVTTVRFLTLTTMARSSIRTSASRDPLPAAFVTAPCSRSMWAVSRAIWRDASRVWACAENRTADDSAGGAFSAIPCRARRSSPKEAPGGLIAGAARAGSGCAPGAGPCIRVMSAIAPSPGRASVADLLDLVERNVAAVRQVDVDAVRAVAHRRHLTADGGGNVVRDHLRRHRLAEQAGRLQLGLRARHVVDALDRRELGELGQELGLVLRLQRVLVCELGHEELQKLLLPKLSASGLLYRRAQRR